MEDRDEEAEKAKIRAEFEKLGAFEKLVTAVGYGVPVLTAVQALDTDEQQEVFLDWFRGVNHMVGVVARRPTLTRKDRALAVGLRDSVPAIQAVLELNWPMVEHLKQQLLAENQPQEQIRILRPGDV